MDKEELKQKIIKYLKDGKYTSSFKTCQIGNLLFLVAKNFQDINNPSHQYILYDALCELENAGIVIKNSINPFEKSSKEKIIQASRWYLK